MTEVERDVLRRRAAMANQQHGSQGNLAEVDERPALHTKAPTILDESVVKDRCAILLNHGSRQYEVTVSKFNLLAAFIIFYDY